MSFYSKHLHDGEQIIATIRRNWLTFLPKILLVCFWFFWPFFFMFPLLAWGQVGPIIFVILMAIALLYLLKLISLFYFSCLIITTERLIDFAQTKTFSRAVKETDFLNISEVGYKISGFLQMISKSGNLEIKLKSSHQEPSLIIKGISRPEEIHNLILDLKKLAEEESRLHDKREQVSETYQDILKKIKKDIGEEGIKRLLNSLPRDTNQKNNSRDLEFLK